MSTDREDLNYCGECGMSHEGACPQTETCTECLGLGWLPSHCDGASDDIGGGWNIESCDCGTRFKPGEDDKARKACATLLGENWHMLQRFLMGLQELNENQENYWDHKEVDIDEEDVP